MWSRRKEGAASPFRREALAYLDALHSFARYLSGDERDADDLVQETYARAFAAVEQFTPGSNLQAWLFRILRNLFIDRYRRAKGGPIASLSIDALDESGAPSVPAGTPDPDAVTSADVQAAMMALPEPSRTIVLLDLEGMNDDEMATILGCASGTVKSRLFRARAALRELLKDYAPARRPHGL